MQGGQGGAVWAAPWGLGAAAQSLAGAFGHAGLRLVVAPGAVSAPTPFATLRFPAADPAGLAVARAAIVDRMGRLDGLAFVLPAPLDATVPAAEALQPIAALEALRAGLGPALPWVLVLPDAAGARAGAAAALALQGAALGLARAAQAAGQRADVCLLPRAVWQGAPVQGRAALGLMWALEGGPLRWAAVRARRRLRP